MEVCALCRACNKLSNGSVSGDVRAVVLFIINNHYWDQQHKSDSVKALLNVSGGEIAGQEALGKISVKTS